MRSAYEDQLIGDNSAVGVRLPRIEKSEIKAWTPEQVGQFLDVATGHRLGALFEVVMFTGLRRGEALGLHWADVDLAGRTITVRENRTQVGGNAVSQTPKTKAGARTIAGLPKLNFHGQRYQAISVMLEAGVPIAIASKRAGHSSIQVTVDRYGHSIGSASRDTAESTVLLVPRDVPALTLHTRAGADELKEAPKTTASA